MGRIKTYGRIKPSTHLYPHYTISPCTRYLTLHSQPADTRDDVHTTPSRSTHTAAGKPSHRFQFSQVFDYSATQQQVYDDVAQRIVTGFLNGYNGTIFAYGQTGSGKTYTVEGSARLYCDRGLAPRALSHVYDVLAERQKAEDIEIHVSYMEIYQEIGYDLLTTASRPNMVIQSFPKVVVLEGPGGSVMVRNLTQHLAPTEHVAQQLLFQGQANRHIAETPMNQRSSRSHAVFTVSMKARQRGADTYIRSKLHLVDLAGSERVSKTGVEGQQLAEAKFINLSLHHLEGVIIALQGETDKWPGHKPPSADLARIYNRHVPYRNSLLTMVLRDSLGGNCLTAMIATVSMEERNLGETLSTCRFSQRVACITNVAMKNEEIDDLALIKQLRKHIAQLQAEISRLKADQKSGDAGAGQEWVTMVMDVDCLDVMNRFLAERIKDPISAGITTPSQFRECLRILKSVIVQNFHSNKLHPVPVSLPGAAENHIKPHPSTDKPHPFIDKTLILTNKSPERTQNVSTRTRVSSAPVRRKLDVAPRTEENEELFDHTHLNHNQSLDPSSPPRQVRKRPRPKSSPLKRSASDIAEKATSVKLPYKSPFEQQRERQIEKVSLRVEEKRHQQEQQRHQLTELRSELKQEQLHMLSAELSKKIELNREKIAEQHAYLQLLTESGADSQLIEQETIAQLYLQKRQKKMEDRLEKVRQQLEKLQLRADKMISKVAAQNKITEHTIDKDVNRLTEQCEENGKIIEESVSPPGAEEKKQSKDKPTNLEDKFSKFIGKSGKLNARKVLEILQQQEQRQEKKQKKLERDRILALSTQVEVKETATRMKLQEFRNMLKHSKQDSDRLNRGNYGSTGDLQIPSSNNTTYSRPHSSPHQRHHIVVPTHVSSVEVDSDTDIPVDNEHSVTQTDSVTDLHTDQTSLFSSSQSSFFKHSSPSPSSHKLSTQKRDPTELWESRYSFLSHHNSIPSFEIPKPAPISASNERNRYENMRHNGVSVDVVSVKSVDSDIDGSTDTHNPSHSLTGLYVTSSQKSIGHQQNNNTARLHRDRNKTFDKALSSMLAEDQESMAEMYRKFSVSEETDNLKMEILNPQISTGSANRDDIETRLACYINMDSPAVSETKSQQQDHNHTAHSTDYDVSTLLAMHKLKRLINSKSKDDTHMGSSSSVVSDIHTCRQTQQMQERDHSICRIRALPDTEREETYMSSVQAQKDRVARIRKAQKSAEIIQRIWRKYREKNTHVDR